MLFCASSEGSGESAHLHGLPYPSSLYQISYAASNGDFVLCTQAAKTLMSLNIYTGSPEPRHNTETSCAGDIGLLDQQLRGKAINCNVTDCMYMGNSF